MYLHILILLYVLPSTSSQTTEKFLLDHLLKDYSPFVRPVFNKSHPVVVTFGFELAHIVSIVENTQTFVAKVWLRMSWKNELLKWNPHKWGNITRTRLNADSLWTPDIFLEEDSSTDMSSGPVRYKTLVILTADGTNSWNIPTLLHSSCIFDVTNFPFDLQHCTFKFISWTHDQSEMDIKQHKAPVVTSNYINSSEWNLMHVHREIRLKKYNCCPNPYVDISYTFALKRKPLYYVYNVVVPCVIQMMIILFTFFLPPDSGERIGVAITVLLVFAVYLEVLSGSLPKTSTVAPALSRFYLSAMGGSAFSIIATYFVLVIHFKGAEKGIGPMPLWVRNFFVKYIAKFLFVRQNLRTHDDKELLALEKHGSYAELKINEENQLEQKDDKILNRNLSIASEVTMEKLVEEVRVITALIHDQNLQDEIEEEWQILAKVFDRMFFIMFLFIFVISTLTILHPIYQDPVE